MLKFAPNFNIFRKHFFQNKLVNAARLCSTTVSKQSAENISDYFTQLGSVPDPELQQNNVKIKQYLRELYPNTLGNDTKLQQMFDKNVLSIEKQLNKIDNLKQEIIPQLKFDDVNNYLSGNVSNINDSVLNDIHKCGTFVIRNVIDPNLVIEYKERVLDYIKTNNGYIGFPKDNPQVYEIYYSKSQISARQHANMYRCMQFANSLWKYDNNNANDPNDSNTSVEPLLYIDRMRIRQPRDNSFLLGPHIDGGSIERWQDENYRSCYANILSDNMSSYISNNEIYNYKHRIQACMDLYNTENNCSAFRTFQGWLSISDNILPNYGSLRVSVLLNESTIYWLLRPFLKDLNDFDFAGVFGGKGLNILNEYHKLLFNTIISIPQMNFGDLVFWHCDTIHCVDNINESYTNDSSVFYIPSIIKCKMNLDYIQKQKKHFELGKTPPDFPQTDSEIEFKDRGNKNDLNDYGLKLMGYN